MIIFKKLRWKNFLSTGNNWTELDLTDSQSSLIVGENGAGKSTFLDALTFSLFGRPYRKINKPQLVNSINDSDCLAEIEFEIGTNEYKIVRGLKPHILEIYVNGQLIDQDGKLKDYQSILEKRILQVNFKSFTQIIILGSSTFQPFMQLNPAQRRDVIEDLLDIQIFSRMNEILKFQIADVKQNITTVTNSIKFNEEKKELLKSYIKRNRDATDEKIEKLKITIMESLDMIEQNHVKKKNLESDRDKLKDNLLVYDNVDDEITRLKTYLSQVESKIKRVTDKIEFYDDNDSCHVCKQDISDDHKGSVIDELEANIEDSKSAKDEMVDFIAKKSKLLDERNQLSSSLVLINSEIDELIQNTKWRKKSIDVIETEIIDLTKIKEKSSGDDQRMKDIVSEHVTLSSNREELVESRHYNGIAYELLKDTGIKTSIIKQYLPIMNNKINKYLQDFDCFFNFTLDENFDEVIKSNYRDEFSYESFSEGEKMRIDLALLFTWREISKMKNSANTNLLILDEIFDSSLDDNGTEEFMKILTTLDDSVNVFVISHKGDILVDKFDRTIKFEKVNNFSRMV